MDENVRVRMNEQGLKTRLSGGHKGRSKRRPLKIVAISISAIVGIAIVVLALLFFYQSTTGAVIDKNKYQAVFFTNGQVYFGKLQTLNGNYMKLNDIFYLQASTSSTNPQQTSTQAATDVQLIKLGSEVHGPTDEMIVNKDQVLFFENLKSDGKVTQSIEKYKNQ